MSSLKDVAEHAKVSIATVSRVLNKEKIVSPKTRLRVERAIKKLDYHPNRVAQRLRRSKRRNKLIGLVLPDIQNPFYVDVIKGVEEFAYLNNYAVMIGNFSQDSKKEQLYIDILQSEEVDGFILAPSLANKKRISKLLNDGFPVVCIDRNINDLNVDVVKVENELGTSEAIDYLISLGHKRIAYISGSIQIQTSLERIKGYEKSMEKYGIEIDSKYVKKSNSEYDEGVQLMRELLELEEPPTAVFTSNNLLTLGALETIHKQGLKIPEDISIVGFDDMYWSMSLNPPLTAVRQSGQEIGKRAAELLLQRIQDTERAKVNLVLSTELMIRKSCGKVKQEIVLE